MREGRGEGGREGGEIKPTLQSSSISLSHSCRDSSKFFTASW